MLNEITKRRILDDRFAFDKDELVTVNALDLCDELIEHENLKRNYTKLLKELQRLQWKLQIKELDTKEYRHINLRI
ncbi:MAG TPA: hypothetical protein VFM18_22370 [Methanosarcina sp.]|nr:hypothetical protein [Methanosarcina sp.]